MDTQIVWAALQLAATLVVGFGSVWYARRLINDDSLHKAVAKNTSDIAYLKGVISGLFRDDCA